MSHPGWGGTLAQTGCMEGQKRSALTWKSWEQGEGYVWCVWGGG